jgi:pimeloyl-ACP methyl ester carboxylesterase
MERLQDLIVFLPGITGSVLQKDGKDVWGFSGEGVWRALTSRGVSIRDLALQGDDPNADDLGDGVSAVRVMPDAHLVPGFWKIDGYSAFTRVLTNTFSVVRGSLLSDRPANFYEFPYDWRRDNRPAARQLKRRIERWLPRWRDHSGANDAKIILVAHSMGGLVARHYLEVLEGWQDCRALITFGTPYRGSLNALDYLVNGYKRLFVDLTETMRTFTSVYQLLPIYRAVRSDGDYVRVAEVKNIPGVDQARAVDALGFHRDIEHAVEAHKEEASYADPATGYRILPIVGVRQPTLQSAEVLNGRLTATQKLPDWIDEALAGGDGTVPRVSATPIELSDEFRETFVTERHASLQANDSILADIKERLLQMQARQRAPIRGPALRLDAAKRPALSLDLDDLYLPDEPVVVRATLVSDHGGRPVNVRADISPPKARVEAAPRGGAPLFRAFVPADDGWLLRLDDLTPGLYRIEVQAELGAARLKVRDLFEIAG